MDQVLLSKVKDILKNCTPENVDKIKSKLMVSLKPDDAELIYEYFIRMEPTFIKDKCKVHANQVIPQYSDYFKTSSSITDIFLDDYGGVD
jgi:hypothetical protein